MPHFLDNRFALIDGDLKVTGEGYLMTRARAARTGIQVYSGAELGIPSRDTIRVYRPEEEVFSDAAIASFAMAPVTVDHPAEMVDARNHSRLSVGTVGSRFMREGESVIVDLAVKDFAAVDAVSKGKRQLSVGYTADIEMKEGRTPAGEVFDAVQRNIRVNHLAIVDEARAGPEYRIGDSASIWLDHSKKEPQDMPNDTRTIMVDGHQVETTAAGEQTIKTLLAQRDERDSQIATLKSSVADANKGLATKDGEIAALKQQLDDAMNPKVLARAAAERAAVIDAARKMGVDMDKDDEEMTPEDMRRKAMAKRMGADKVKDWSDDQVRGAFDATLAAMPTDSRSAGRVDPMREDLRDSKRGAGQYLNDAATGWDRGIMDAAGVRVRKH